MTFKNIKCFYTLLIFTVIGAIFLAYSSIDDKPTKKSITLFELYKTADRMANEMEETNRKKSMFFKN